MERGKGLNLTSVMEKFRGQIFPTFQSPLSIEMLEKYLYVAFEFSSIEYVSYIYSKDSRYAHLKLDKDKMVQLWKEVEAYI